MPQWWLRRILLGASRTLLKFKRTQNSVPRRRRDLIPWAPARKDRSGNVNTSNFLFSIYEVREERKSVFPAVRIKTTKVHREVKTSLLEEENQDLLFELPFYQSSPPPPTHDARHRFQCPIRAKQDKTNTEAIDINIHSNESPSIISTVRLSFSQVRPNR